MNAVTLKKYDKLIEILKELNSVAVAFSGGVDSSFLLHTAKEALGEKVMAITVIASMVPEQEQQRAVQMAKETGVYHRLMPGNEEAEPRIAENSPERCYYCKRHLFTMMKAMTEEEGFAYLVDGTNADDASDYRPGRKALKELQIRSPLEEAGLTKDEIRQLSKEAGLSTWNLPAMACLASRIPYGTQITAEKLRRIESCEAFLLELGYREFRVRDHGEVARIELGYSEMPGFLRSGGHQEEIIRHFKVAGFKYISLDLEGYRTGSMNEGKWKVESGKWKVES
ncbi:MAG: ATP-dependent sacrificial sulfur transferase LarE [Tindallia sp. MSAO_Bac2]|nr:MAG: ATP-dependent sacrificial sulfur transferase LarE [Tindallia sp. MSAO_Bac2]